MVSQTDSKYPVVNSIESRPAFYSISGPSSIESFNQIDTIFNNIVMNITHMRGGVFRSGAYPGEYFGLKLELLKFFHKKSKQLNRPNVIDIVDIRELEVIEPYAEVFQVGIKDDQDYSLLTEIGKQKKPVILNRGAWMKIDELLEAAEYIAKGGNENIILCERGGVSHLDHCRWELSISMIAALKNRSGLPVIIDASYGTGNANLVRPMTFAGITAGADGFIVECHDDLENSISNSQHEISINDFKNLSLNAARYKIERDERDIMFLSEKMNVEQIGIYGCQN